MSASLAVILPIWQWINSCQQKSLGGSLDKPPNYSYTTTMSRQDRREYMRRYYRENRLKAIWWEMNSRCSKPKHSQCKNYGGRGIKVCDEWKSNYFCFENWALQNGYRRELQIDRIDGDDDYKPENCRFVTSKDQARNTRKNVNLTFRGKTQCISAWAEELGMKRQTIHFRLRYLGWTVEKALLVAVQNRSK